MNRRSFFGLALGGAVALVRPKPRLALRRRERIVLPASGFEGWYWSRADGQAMYVSNPGVTR